MATRAASSWWSRRISTKAESPGGDARAGRPVYLNNAATSHPKAPGLSAEVSRWLDAVPRESGRSAGGGDPLRACRAAVARACGLGDPDRIILTKNATEALNIAICGLGLAGGAAVMTSCAEHNSVLRPLYRLEREGAIRLLLLPCDPQGRVDASAWCEALRTHRPALAVLTHASNVTGAIHSATELLAAARACGAVTLLDATQTLGVVPLDGPGGGADLVAWTGHKYLLGPQGTGGLAVVGDVNLQPLVVGGTGVRSDLKDMPPEMPQRFEAGTAASALFAALAHAVEWIAGQPWPDSSAAAMAVRLEEGLRAAGARVLPVQGPRTAVVSFSIPGWSVSDAGSALERGFGIVCRAGLHCAPLVHEHTGFGPQGTIRFSPSRFTSDDDLSFAVDAVRRIAAR